MPSVTDHAAIYELVSIAKTNLVGNDTVKMVQVILQDHQSLRLGWVVVPVKILLQVPMILHKKVGKMVGKK